MKILKNYVILIAILVLHGSFVSCDKEDDNNDNNTTPTSQSFNIEGVEYNLSNCYIKYVTEVNGVHTFNLHLYSGDMDFVNQTGSGKYFSAVIFTDNETLESGTYTFGSMAAGSFNGGVFYDNYNLESPEEPGLYYATFEGVLTISLTDNNIEVDVDLKTLKSTDASQHHVTGKYSGSYEISSSDDETAQEIELTNIDNCYVEYLAVTDGIYRFEVHLYESNMDFAAETGAGEYLSAFVYTDSRIFEGGQFTISNTGNPNTVGAAVFYDNYDFSDDSFGTFYSAYEGSINIVLTDDQIEVDADLEALSSGDASQYNIKGVYSGNVQGLEEISWGEFEYDGNSYTFQNSKVIKTENYYEGFVKYELLVAEEGMDIENESGIGNYLVAVFYTSESSFNNTSFSYGEDAQDGNFTLKLYSEYDLSDKSYNTKADVTSGALVIKELDEKLIISFTGMIEESDGNQYNLSGDFQGNYSLETIDFSTITQYAIYDDQLILLESFSLIDGGNVHIVRMGTSGIILENGGEGGTGSLIQFLVYPDKAIKNTYTIGNSGEPGTSTCSFTPNYPSGAIIDGIEGTLTTGDAYEFNVSLENGKTLVGKY